MIFSYIKILIGYCGTGIIIAFLAYCAFISGWGILAFALLGIGLWAAKWANRPK